MPSSGRGSDSPSPLQEPVLWRGARSAKPRVRVRFPAGSPGCPRPAAGRPSSKRRGAGSTPAGGSFVLRSLMHLSPSARWPRRPDPHSGDAGSNPAGDAEKGTRPRGPQGRKDARERGEERRRGSALSALLSPSLRPCALAVSRSDLPLVDSRSHRGVAQPGKSACLGDRRSPVRIRPPRPTSHPLPPAGGRGPFVPIC